MKKYAFPFLSLIVLWCGPVLADSRDDVLENVARCGRIVDARAWLNCYYGAAQPMRDQLSLPPAPQIQTQAVPSPGMGAPAPSFIPAPAAIAQPGVPQTYPAPATPRRGGLMAKLFGGQNIVTNVRAADYKFDSRGIFTITLADGSVWQQVGDDNSHPDWRGTASRLVVSVKTGALQSYSLLVAGDDHLYKVVRVR